MAFVATLIKQSVMGNERVAIYSVSTDVASGQVATSMGYIDSISYAPVSMTTAAIRMKANLNNASATANGTVFVSSCTSGDVFFLTVYGRS